MKTKRIEYLDAMRGFTMITVVLWHVIFFGYNKYLLGISTAIMTFRMPIFFFISGFIFYKSTRLWTINVFLEILKNKFRVQIIPTFVFLCIFIPFLNLRVEDVVLSGTHGGYWFTITLFGYFVLYSLIMLLLKRFNEKAVVLITILIALILDVATRKSSYPLAHFILFQYFIYFILGTFSRQYLNLFQKILDNDKIMSFIIFLWLSTLLLFHSVQTLECYRTFVTYFIWGGMGILVVFKFFQKNESIFSSNNKIGSVLQFIGRRTLDIYLIHYFFIPRNLTSLGVYFEANLNPSVEFFISLIISVIVICFSLLVSSIIRLSPFLAHWLLGVKYNS